MSDEQAVNPDILDADGNVIVNGDGTTPSEYDCMPIWRNFSEETRRQVAAANWVSTSKDAEHPGDPPVDRSGPKPEAPEKEPEYATDYEAWVDYYDTMEKWVSDRAQHMRDMRDFAYSLQDYEDEQEVGKEEAKRYTTEITVPVDGGEPLTYTCTFCPLGLGLYLDGRMWRGSGGMIGNHGVPDSMGAAAMLLGLPSHRPQEAARALEKGTGDLLALENGATRYEWLTLVDPSQRPSEIVPVQVADLVARYRTLDSEAGSFIAAWDNGHITNEQLIRALCLHESEWPEPVTEEAQV